MNEKQATKLGKKHGKQMSSWVDVPEIGSLINRDIDWVGNGKYVTKDNMWDYMQLLCESHCNECYNDCLADEDWDEDDNHSGLIYDNDDLYNAYWEGITDGIFSRIAEAQKNYQYNYTISTSYIAWYYSGI